MYYHLYFYHHNYCHYATIVLCIVTRVIVSATLKIF